jgi:adenosylhomocysteine nucleosidase
MKTILVIFSANSEWRNAKAFYNHPKVKTTPYGEYFQEKINDRLVILMQGGWGKISAAASVQYGIQVWQPEIVINLGTCGGLEGQVEKGTIVLAEETMVYDIYEQMGDRNAALAFYSVKMDLSWLKPPFPQPVRRGRLLSADRDILTEDVNGLIEDYGGFAADWESGAIAWVCQKNGIFCLILRGVSDLVNSQGGEAYGAIDVFHQSTQEIIVNLLTHLPAWIDCIQPA